MDNNLTEAQRWLSQAQHDIRAAAHNREGGFNEIACFLAQQAAEKALKAFLYAQGERPVLGHATFSSSIRPYHSRPYHPSLPITQGDLK